MEFEKEKFVEYVEKTIIDIKDSIAETSDNSTTEINAEIRKELLGLVNNIRELKEADINNYNSILKEIPYIEYFEEEVEDLNQAKEYLSSIVSSKDSNYNTEKFAELMKSSEIYYYINKKSKKDFSEEELLALGDIGLIKDYLQSIWPSAKQEELLGLLLYINSGKATEDYIEFLGKKTKEDKSKFLYNKFKSSLYDLYANTENEESVVEVQTKNQKNISPKNKLDSGIILDRENKKLFIGFATASTDVKSQKKQYFEKMNAITIATKTVGHELYGYTIKPTYLTNSFFNEHELKEGQREHKKAFLSAFSKPLTKIEKNKLNCLSFLAIAGNITMHDAVKGLEIKEFTKVNPYVAGADSLWMHEAFKKIESLEKIEEKHIKLREFLVKQANTALTILNDKLPNNHLNEMDITFAQIFSNIENIIYASMDLFNENNMSKKAVYNKKFLNELTTTIALYKEVHINKFNGATPSEASLINGKELYNNYKTVDRLIEKLEENNEELKRMFKNTENVKKNSPDRLKNEALKEVENYVPIIVDILREKCPELVRKEENIKDVISEILVNVKLYPARDAVKAVISAKDNSINLRNFLQNYEKWKEESSAKNVLKFELSKIIFNNASNPDLIIENLKIYKVNRLEEFKKVHSETKVKKTKSLKTI